MLFTIGYEGSTPKDFLATLEDFEVSLLVDIRDRAQSRRPGFSKGALSSMLIAAGIRYEHFGELGDPKEGRDAARAGKHDLFLQIYQQVLLSQPAHDAVEKLIALTSREKVCLLCYERNPIECHRQLVSRAIEKRTNEHTTHLGVRSSEQVASSPRRVPDFSKSATPPQ